MEKSYIEQGLFAFTYGQGDSVVDFVHVNNLVQAHILAGKALKTSNSVAVSIIPEQDMHCSSPGGRQVSTNAI